MSKILTLSLCGIIGIGAMPIVSHKDVLYDMHTVYADENPDTEQGKVGISVWYSDDITPMEGDIFIITYKLRYEENAKTNQLEIDTSTLANTDGIIELPAKHYEVTSFEYKGENPAIINYACMKNFTSETRYSGTLFILIGLDKIQYFKKVSADELYVVSDMAKDGEIDYRHLSEGDEVIEEIKEKEQNAIQGNNSKGDDVSSENVANSDDNETTANQEITIQNINDTKEDQNKIEDKHETSSTKNIVKILAISVIVILLGIGLGVIIAKIITK